MAQRRGQCEGHAIAVGLGGVWADHRLLSRMMNVSRRRLFHHPGALCAAKP
jgi:hypothetical protein